MAPKPVTLTFAGDDKSLTRTFDNVGAGAKEMAGKLDSASDKAKQMGSSFDTAADRMDASEGKLMGTADLLDGLATTMGLPIDGAIQMTRGFADMASGIKATVIPGLQSLWATMMANPIVAIAAVVGVLVTAFVVAYQKSETFRNVVDAAFRGVQQVVGDVIGWILDGVDKFLGGLASMAEAAGKLPIVGDKFDGIAESIRGAQQDVRNLADDMHNLGVDADEATPKLAGIAGILGTLRDRPLSGGLAGIMGTVRPATTGRRAAGGPVGAGGAYLVGEQGPEMFVPGTGGTVVPHAGGTQVIQVVVDGKVLTEVVHDGLLVKQRRSGNLGFAAT